MFMKSNIETTIYKTATGDTKLRGHFLRLSFTASKELFLY